LPEPRERNRRTSPAATVILVALGSTRELELTSVGVPVKRHSRTMPAATVPSEVIEAVPVI